MSAKFELKKLDSGKYMFNLKAGNGEVVLTSQPYADKSGALGGVESVKVHARKDGFFERKVASNNQPFFTLNSSNGQVIGKSEMYSSASAMNNGIDSVRRNAQVASVVELG